MSSNPSHQTSSFILKQLPYMLRIRQYLCINNSDLDISYQGAPYLLPRISPIIKVLSMPMQPTLKTLACHCTYALMEIGINRLSALLTDSLTHIIDGNKLTFLFGRKIKTKHIIALNRLSHTLNTPTLAEDRPDLINTIIHNQDSSPNKTLESRCINNTIYAEMMKTEHTPTGWNWSKHHPSYADPDPHNSNPHNGSHAFNTLTPPGPRTYSNPLFDAEDMEVENASPSSQEDSTPNS